MSVKKAIGVLVVVILAIVAFGVTIATYGDTMVTDAVNRLLARELASGGKVERVHVGLFSGELTIENLKIFNPEGFNSNEMLILGNGFTRVSLRELIDKKINIEELKLRDLTFRVERSGVRTNVTEAFGGKKRKKASSQKPRTPGEKKPIHVTISRITIENVKFFAPKIAEKNPLQIKRMSLEGPFRLGPEGGLKKILDSLAKELQKKAVKEAVKSLKNPEKAREKIEEGLKGIKKLFGK